MSPAQDPEEALRELLRRMEQAFDPGDPDPDLFHLKRILREKIAELEGMPKRAASDRNSHS